MDRAGTSMFEVGLVAVSVRGEVGAAGTVTTWSDLHGTQYQGFPYACWAPDAAVAAEAISRSPTNPTNTTRTTPLSGLTTPWSSIIRVAPRCGSVLSEGD